MVEKPMTEKEKARMLFKRHKAGIRLSADEIMIMIKYYGRLVR